MGVEGQRTYPHNSLVEAAYSLGASACSPTWCSSARPPPLRSSVRAGDGRAGDQAVALAVGLGAFAIAKTNISGEIGEDAILWSAAALAVVALRGVRSTAVEGSAPDEAAILRCR